MFGLLEKFKALPSDLKASCVIIPLLILAAMGVWYSPANRPVEQQRYIPAQPIKGTDVAKTPKTVKSGVVKVIPKGTIEDKVKPLPPEIKNNDAVEVMDTAEVPPSEWGHKVISSINTDSGDTALSIKENTPPLFGWENKKRIGVGYGVGTQGTTAKVYAAGNFIRVGSFHIGAVAEINATTTHAPEAKAMATIEYGF